MRNELKFDCGHKAWIDHKDDPDNPGGIIKIPGGSAGLDEQGAIYCRTCRDTANA